MTDIEKKIKSLVEDNAKMIKEMYHLRNSAFLLEEMIKRNEQFFEENCQHEWVVDIERFEYFDLTLTPYVCTKCTLSKKIT
jgi:hypothetical protein